MKTHLRVVMVTHEMVHEGRARVPVSSNGDPFVDAVSVQTNDVVKLVGHATAT